MCTVLLPPGDNPIAVNKYIINEAGLYMDDDIKVKLTKMGVGL